MTTSDNTRQGYRSAISYYRDWSSVLPAGEQPLIRYLMGACRRAQFARPGAAPDRAMAMVHRLALRRTTRRAYRAQNLGTLKAAPRRGRWQGYLEEANRFRKAQPAADNMLRTWVKPD